MGGTLAARPAARISVDPLRSVGIERVTPDLVAHAGPQIASARVAVVERLGAEFVRVHAADDEGDLVDASRGHVLGVLISLAEYWAAARGARFVDPWMGPALPVGCVQERVTFDERSAAALAEACRLSGQDRGAAINAAVRLYVLAVRTTADAGARRSELGELVRVA